MDESELVACGSALLQQLSDNFSSYDKETKPSVHVSGLVSIREKGPGSAPKQCQLCEQWITAKNTRVHVAAHLTLRRLRCSACGQGFDRMNRASVHIDRCHPDDPTAKVESAMNAEQRKQIDMLAMQCFPRRKLANPSNETN
ncbi:unnamed protein product [Angiostrongylus costaricensis]|uniref:C2H2-type domain-containing protein n=1 Tax=Angiostrongylus costaricensis TaxID=334426 RepID=A0A0R3PA10_ANGCS|nr:unnamed protein product [Angiostrongylus costaricensis]